MVIELVEISIGAMLTDESDLPAFPLRMLELLKQVLPDGTKDIHHHKGRITNACGAMSNVWRNAIKISSLYNTLFVPDAQSTLSSEYYSNLLVRMSMPCIATRKLTI